MAQKKYNKEETIKYYDENAEKWKTSHGGDEDSFWKPEIEEFKKFLIKGKVLEIGSGSGKEADLLIKAGLEYTGVDLSKGLLELAKKQNPTGNFLEASVYKLPFNDKSFDGFWASAVLLHIPYSKIDLALSEIKRVTKTNGVGFISLKSGAGERQDGETKRWFTFYSKQKFIGILIKNGFKILKITSQKDKVWWLSFFVQAI